MKEAIHNASQVDMKIQTKKYNREKIREFSPDVVFGELLEIYHSAIKKEDLA